MNKKQIIIIGIILVLLVLVLVITKITSGSGTTYSLNNPPAKNDEEIEKRVSWGQSQISVSVFSTREDPVGQVLEDKQNVHVIFTSFFSITSLYPMKEIKVDVVDFKQGIGTPVFIFPPNTPILSSRSYIYTDMNSRVTANDIKDSGKTGSFKIVPSNPTNYDELIPGGGFLNFELVSKNLGTISSQEIMSRDNIYSSDKLLQYLGITADQLNGSIVLDYTITFEDGKTYTKRFTGVIDGSAVLNETFYTINLK